MLISIIINLSIPYPVLVMVKIFVTCLYFTSLSHSGPYTNTDVIAERAPTPLTRNVMVQTDYRESETQTDPYTPECVAQPGSSPELLTVANLSWGNFFT